MLRKDTEYLNDLNMWSHQASLMLCAQKSLVCKWWWLDESQLFVSQLFVRQLFYWFWPFAASNIFLRPSMPDMASTFFLQSLTSTVFSCSTHRIHMRDMIFHSLPLILGENISRRPDVHILCTRGVNDYLYSFFFFFLPKASPVSSCVCIFYFSFSWLHLFCVLLFDGF